MRISLKVVLSLATAAGITIYSLLFANPWIGDAYFTVAVAMVVLAIIAAIQLQGNRRAYWTGFAFCGAAYCWYWLHVSEMQLVNTIVGTRTASRDTSEPQMITTSLLTACYETFCLSERDPRISVANSGVVPFGYGTTATRQQLDKMLQVMDPSYRGFMSVGQSVFAIVCAVLGGTFSQRLYRSRAAPASAP